MTVFPVEPMRSEEEAIEVKPVPPDVTLRADNKFKLLILAFVAKKFVEVALVEVDWSATKF